MRVLFLVRLWPVFGGGETVTRRLANEFVKRNIEVHILYTKYNNIKDEDLLDKRVFSSLLQDVYCDERGFDSKSSRYVNKFLIEYINTHNINIVFNQWFPFEFIKDIKRFTVARVIKCLHTAFITPVEYDNSIKGLIKRVCKPIMEIRNINISNKIVNDFLPYVDKYVFLSEQFQKQYQYMSNNVDIDHQLISIPNPLTYDDQISETELIQKDNIVLVVARMEEGCKRLSRVLETWKIIESDKDERLKPWKIQFVGVGTDLDYYKLSAKEFGLKRISFEGFQNPLSYYKKAKIFLMTSSFEGFGMTLLESQQNGVVPIVMDTFLSLHDIVKNNDNGVITRENIKSYSYELKKLMTDNELLDRLSRKGVETSRNFCLSEISNRWQKLFWELSN